MIITIIVMMILVGVTVSVVMQGGLFDKATIAVIKQETATMQEYIVTAGADLLADKAKDGDTLNVTVEEILTRKYNMALTAINFETIPDYISNVDEDPEGTCYLLDASELHVDSSRGNGTAQTGKDIFVVDSNKRVYYIIEGKIGQGGDIPPEDIPYDIAKINYIEDLVELAIKVNNGTFENEYKTAYPDASEIVVTLERDLNFKDPNSYRTQDPANKEYTDAEGNKIDANGDGTPEPIMTEMIGITVVESDGTETTTGLGFKPIGNIDMQTEEIKSFKGTFEGNNNTISNLYINRPEEMAVGLFGMIGINTCIQNLEVTGNITGPTGEGYTGGIVAACLENSFGNIKFDNCHIREMKINGSAIGGICGFIVNLGEDEFTKITFSNSSISDSTIQADQMAAGMFLAGSECEFNMISCKSIGNTITAQSASGLVYSVDAFVDSYVTNGLTSCSLEECYNSSKIVATEEASGIITNIGGYDVKLLNCNNEGDIELIAPSDVYDAECIGIGYIDGNGNISIDSCCNSGDILVSGAGQAVGVGQLAGENADSIIFKDCLNSGNITISNGAKASGVAYIDGKIYCDFAVEKCINTGNIKETSESGNYNCYASGIIMGSYESHRVRNCYNTGEISTATAEGIGRSAQNCYNLGKIFGFEYAVGISKGAGKSSSTISNCYNLGKIESATAETAFSIGDENNSTITNCHALTGNEDATAKETLLNALNANRDDTTTWSEWTIVDGVNNGYPIFTWQNVEE